MKDDNTMIGKTFSRLTVVRRADDSVSPSGRKHKMWVCACACGQTAVVEDYNLRSGKQVSCGCYRKMRQAASNTKHGMTDTRLYYVWSSIKSRCSNPNVYEYEWYGGRGITMCDEWRNSFQAFYDWAIAHGYDESAPRGQCTIDRIDCDAGYSPENCRIITQAEQMNNVRTNHILRFNGEDHTIAEWSRITGINQFKIRNRVARLGWTTERALTTQ